MNVNWKYIILIAVMVVLFALPLLLSPQAEFSGVDGQAERLIQQVQIGYRPWRSPIWQPPSSEIQSLLFSVQTGIGALIIGYYIGVMKAGSKSKMTGS